MLCEVLSVGIRDRNVPYEDEFIRWLSLVADALDGPGHLGRIISTVDREYHGNCVHRFGLIPRIEGPVSGFKSVPVLPISRFFRILPSGVGRCPYEQLTVDG